MAVETRQRQPSDPAFPGLTPDDLSLFMDEGIYGEVQDASKRSRGAAIGRFAREADCDFTQVRCGVRYVLLHDRQDLWDGPGRDSWADNLFVESGLRHRYDAETKRHYLVDKDDNEVPEPDWPDPPDEPPADWEPSEYMPCWEFVAKTHPRALKVYICEVKGQEHVLSGGRS